MGQETTVWQSAIDDIRQIIRQGMETAYQAVNASQVMTYWLVGKRIVEQEQHGQDRAEYGKQLLNALSIELTKFLERVIRRDSFAIVGNSIFSFRTSQFGTHAFQI